MTGWLAHSRINVGVDTPTTAITSTTSGSEYLITGKRLMWTLITVQWQILLEGKVNKVSYIHYDRVTPIVLVGSKHKHVVRTTITNSTKCKQPVVHTIMQ